MKFGSLFAGIGGLDLGLERAGMTCRWQVEIDLDCQRWLAYHWPNVRRYENVRDVGKYNLEPVDLIAGGFPCQPHSVAGKQKGAKDDRNLWPEFIRIIREIRPRYVLAENVPGIVTTYLDTVLSDLEGAAYTCWTFNIPACAFDAPHLRKRIFVVAHTNKGCGKQPQQEICPGRDITELRGEDMAHNDGGKWGNGNATQAGSCDQVGRPQEQIGGCGSDVAYTQSKRERKLPVRSRRPLKTTGNLDGSRKDVPRERGWPPTQCNLGMLADGLPPELAGRWLPEPPIGRIAAGIPGLNAKLRALGNAVVPQVAEWIGRRILETQWEK